MINEIRKSVNSFLSGFEPLFVLVVPFVTFFVARIVQSFVGVVQEKGVKSTVVGFFMSCVKYVF